MTRRLTNRLRNAIAVSSLTLGSLFAPVPALADDTDNLERAGDVLQLAIPLTAFGLTYLKDDKEGRKQFLKGVGTTFVTVQGLKAAVDKWRPNYSAENSFPSGHTAAAFSGAAFLQTRYGWRYGVPAYALATFVGYTRIQAEKHYTDDVVAGASIAMLSNWLFTTPLNNGAVLTPTVSQDRVGLNLTMPTGVTRNTVSTPQKPFKPKYRFTFAFGATNLDNNDVAAPASTGSTLDLETFDTYSSPTTSSAVTFDYFHSDRHQFYGVLNPLEVRDQGSFTAPQRFNGALYPAGTPTTMDYVMTELRGGYLYNLLPEGRVDLKVGGGVTFQSTYVRLVSGMLDNSVQSNDFAPYLSLHARFDLTDRLHLDLTADGTSFDSVEFLDASAVINYDLTPQWNIGLGVQSYSRTLETAELNNKYDATSAFLTLAYSF